MGIRGMTVALCLDVNVCLRREIPVSLLLINPVRVCSNISSHFRLLSGAGRVSAS